MKKILTVIGTRPQYIKASIVSKHLEGDYDEILIDTGQHYDQNMSNIFYEGLKLKLPKYNLKIGSGTHASQTSKILTSVEELILKEKPDLIIVYGDTNSTLGGALASAKLNIPIAHIEAGLRSFNKTMPEEINRKIVDHISSFLFSPTENALINLKNEGIEKGCYLVGDVMFDLLLLNKKRILDNKEIFKEYQISEKGYYFVTLHRPYNVDNESTLNEILSAFECLDAPVIFSVHPRTKQKINYLNRSKNIKFIEPVSYFDSLTLQLYSLKVITDSGGIQKEAYFLNTPCVTLRTETEWVETINIGANLLVQNRTKYEIIKNINKNQTFKQENLYGDGFAAIKITTILKNII